MATDANSQVTVFDAATNAVVGSVAFGAGPQTLRDCTILPDRTLGFAADGRGHVWVVDLTTSPPSPAKGINPIPISNDGVDLDLSVDGRYLVACGTGFQPVSVIDVATRTEVESLAQGECTAVDVCHDGSVLVAATSTGQARRLVLDENGRLTNTYETLAIGGPSNVACAPVGSSGLVLGIGGDVTAFAIPGLRVLDRVYVGGYTYSAAFDDEGRRIFAGFWSEFDEGVEVFDYEAASGRFGPYEYRIDDESPQFTLGVDQIALEALTQRLYLTVGNGVRAHDAATGTPLATIPTQAFRRPAAVCFADSLDRDEDGLSDVHDNCPLDANSDQADLDGDAVGDACDECPSVQNPLQQESLACLVADSGAGECIDARIEPIGPQLDGEIRLLAASPGPPRSITFETLATSCHGADPLDLRLNDTPIGSTLLDRLERCTCLPAPETFVVSDAALLADAWRIPGPNTIGIHKPGTHTLLGWVRVRFEAPGAGPASCLLSTADGACTGSNLCGLHRPPFVPVDVEWSTSTQFLTSEDLVSVAPFASGQLPAEIELSGLPDGAARACMTAPGTAARDCLEFEKAGEQAMTINGAACRPPVAVAAAEPYVESSSTAGAAVFLDGSGSSDPSSTPGTRDPGRHRVIRVVRCVWAPVGGRARQRRGYLGHVGAWNASAHAPRDRYDGSNRHRLDRGHGAGHDPARVVAPALPRPALAARPPDDRGRRLTLGRGRVQRCDRRARRRGE
jgi:hypothetical protein